MILLAFLKVLMNPPTNSKVTIHSNQLPFLSLDYFMCRRGWDLQWCWLFIATAWSWQSICSRADLAPRFSILEDHSLLSCNNILRIQQSSCLLFELKAIAFIFRAHPSTQNIAFVCKSEDKPRNRSSCSSNTRALIRLEFARILYRSSDVVLKGNDSPYNLVWFIKLCYSKAIYSRRRSSRII